MSFMVFFSLPHPWMDVKAISATMKRLAVLRGCSRKYQRRKNWE